MYHPYKKTFLTVWCTAIFLGPWACVHAKSLYVVSFDRYLRAFQIAGSKLEFQAQIPIPPHGYGVIDAAIDDESKIIFISC